MKNILLYITSLIMLAIQTGIASDKLPSTIKHPAIKKDHTVKYSRFYIDMLKNGGSEGYKILKNIGTNPFGDDDDLLFSNNKISISPIFPNPATTQASIKYELANDAVKAKVIVCNILGNVVGEYNLSKDYKKLDIITQEFASGVYFYTLNVDGKNVITRRLVIKHNS